MTPTLIITRPEPQGESFAKAVRAAWGKPADIVLSPVIEIVFLPVIPDLAGIQNVIFTSINGVHAAVKRDLPKNMTAWCVGPKTAAAAQDAGYTTVTGPGDAAGLIDLIITEKPPGPLAHIRGAHARGDVTARLSQAGLNCSDIVAYDQKERSLADMAKKRLASDASVVLPVFSPRSAAILAGNGPFKAPLYVIAMSDAVAEVAGSLNPDGLIIATHPNEKAMLDATVAVLDRLEVDHV